jgi:hypothetical protein
MKKGGKSKSLPLQKNLLPVLPHQKIIQLLSPKSPKEKAGQNTEGETRNILTSNEGSTVRNRWI